MKRLGICLKRLDSFSANGLNLVEKGDRLNYSFFIYYLGKYYYNELQLSNKSNLIYRDLSNYYNLRKQIQEDELDGIVIFDPGNLFEMVIISAAKDLGVKTFYYQHGLISEKNVTNVKIDKSNIFNSVFKYLYFTRILFKQLIQTKKFVLNLKAFTKRMYYLFLFDRHTLVRRLGVNSLKFDYGFVYTKTDKLNLVNFMKMKEDDVTVLGFPFIKCDETFRISKSSKSRILYLSSGLYNAGIISEKDELSIYKALAELSDLPNVNLTIKLHPKENSFKVKNILGNKDNIEVIKDGNLSNIVLNSDIVIGDYSTSLFYAIMHYKPIFLLKYDFLSEFPFDYTDYGIGIEVKLDKVKYIFSKLKTEICIDKNNYDKFLNEYSEPQEMNPEDVFYEKIKSVI